MSKRNDIVRYSAKQIRKQLKRGEDQTDWTKIDRTTEADIEASIKCDPDDIECEPDWTTAIAGIPPRKESVTLRIDEDVLKWFRARGKGYQTMMNNVLRAFVQTRQRGKR